MVLLVLLAAMAALRAIARWRFEQIAPLLDSSLSQPLRARLVEKLSGHEVRWPSGADRPISAPTLYRWVRLYLKGGFLGLLPRGRKDRGKPRAIRPEWIAEAFALLRERPARSLYMLSKLLQKKVSRSTLHRHLKQEPGYARLRARAKGTEDRPGLRRRFCAAAPHLIWQADAKGPFKVRLGHERREVHVLTILDDHSRAVLAAVIAKTPDLAAAVRVFRLAAARFGLPEKLYCDRASIFDSLAFRTGLAELGVHRIRTRARNAPAHGKIEAYHRSLGRWFVGELKHQVVRSLEHLEALLLATLEVLYQDHPHRELRTTPRKALSGRISSRTVAQERLDRAFLVRKELKSHPKTGEVKLDQERQYVVPSERFAGRRLTIAYDPASPERAFIEDEKTGQRVPLRPRFEERPKEGGPPERGPGRLQQLLDRYRGRALPQAEAGQGLPELFSLLGTTVGRRVPQDEPEADLVQDFYRRHGPLSLAPLTTALARIAGRLGPGRPLAAYLDALERRIQKAPPDSPNP